MISPERLSPRHHLCQVSNHPFRTSTIFLPCYEGGLHVHVTSVTTSWRWLFLYPQTTTVAPIHFQQVFRTFSPFPLPSTSTNPPPSTCLQLRSRSYSYHFCRCYCCLNRPAISPSWGSSLSMTIWHPYGSQPIRQLSHRPLVTFVRYECMHCLKFSRFSVPMPKISKHTMNALCSHFPLDVFSSLFGPMAHTNYAITAL